MVLVTAALDVSDLSPTGAVPDDFDSAFRPLFLAAYRVAFRILRHREAAEDVAAETLTRAHLHWERILPNRTAWVVRVATNRALDMVRRGPAPFDRPGNRSFEDEAALRLAVATVVAGLPRRQREVVVLRFLVGLAPADVAVALGIGQGSVRRYLDRALRRLRERLGETPW